MAAAVRSRLLTRLQEAGVPFTQREHAAVRTSEEAAAVRGAPLHSGAKALVLKGGDRFLLAVLPADRALDSRALRAVVGSRRIRFASRDELLELTGLTPGAVPPFGSLFGLETVCDPGLADNRQINFNAGSHSHSVQMSYADWAALEQPRLTRIAAPRS
jgi:Ala-tRNA(Pro) deacylase